MIFDTLFLCEIMSIKDGVLEFRHCDNYTAFREYINF